MTADKKDYFAAEAMKLLMSDHLERERHTHYMEGAKPSSEQVLARIAAKSWDMADAMMAEYERRR